MIKTQSITLKIFVINFPIYLYHQILDEYIVQEQPPVVFFRLETFFKKTPTQVFSSEHCKIFKNTYFEKHLRMAASDSSYILNWIRLFKNQAGLLFHFET